MSTPLPPAPALSWHDSRLLRHGEPWQLLAGSMHYFRVHPAQWRDRMRRLADLGVNTVDTYVAWNFHQPREHIAADFTGAHDLERFLAIAHDEGLSAVVRPGPYICAEWANGGFPTWLTGRGIPLRVNDRRFLGPVEEWFDELIPRLLPLQASAGGPIIAVQVENEFGSYGDDPDYMAVMRDMLLDRGVRELLYTSDGPTEAMISSGSISGTLMALNLGSRAAEARTFHTQLRPGEPFFCGEFWNGWFDHWGDPHHVRSAEGAAETLAALTADGGSVSIYMAHGGTNFGTWAGANEVDGELRPTVTSYDSDAAIAEDGTLTAKFFALREVLGPDAPLRSQQPTFLPPQSVPMHRGSLLREWTGPAIETTVPCATDALGIESDLVRFDAELRLPDGETTLILHDVRDRAHVYLDGRFLGSVEGGGEFSITRDRERSSLTIFCEVAGRINYGHRLGEHKGLLGPVLLNRRMVQRWRVAAVPLDDLDLAAAAAAVTAELAESAELAEPALPGEPVFASGTFTADAAADAHLALPGFARGLVWINDVLLGRYWEIGPQQTLYVPAPLVKQGQNTITVLEFERVGDAVELRQSAELGEPEEFTEDF